MFLFKQGGILTYMNHKSSDRDGQLIVIIEWNVYK